MEAVLQRPTSVVRKEAKSEGYFCAEWFSIQFTGNSQEFLVVLSSAFVLLSYECIINSGLLKNLPHSKVNIFKRSYQRIYILKTNIKEKGKTLGTQRILMKEVLCEVDEKYG